MEKVHCLSVNPQTTNIIVLLISPIGWTEGFPNWGHLSKLVKAGERLQDMRPELQSLVLKSVVVHASMLPEPETFDSNISYFLFLLFSGEDSLTLLYHHNLIKGRLVWPLCKCGEYLNYSLFTLNYVKLRVFSSALWAAESRGNPLTVQSSVVSLHFPPESCTQGSRVWKEEPC